MHIQRTHWSKAHLVEAVKFIHERRPLVASDYHEYGVYRGESMQLIENLFYSYQLPVRKGFGFDSFQGLPAETPGLSRFYLFEPGMFADVDFLWPTRATTYVKGWFSNLSAQHVIEFDMKPACLVHIDGDLHVSALQALTFLFSNSLVVPGTVIAYDEFLSTPKLTDGGESLAHIEIAQKFKVKFREFFRNVYFDRLDCWQNCFVVEEIGATADAGIHGWEAPQ